MVTQEISKSQWVLLSYRMPREPSTPRIAVWRRLKNHGVAQVGDGLVALPLDSRTKEQLEWVAAMVLEAQGEAIVWEASTGQHQAEQLIDQLNDDRDAEYESLIADIAHAGASPDGRTLARLRRQWRRIDRRDHLGAPGRESARQAIDGLVPSSVAPAVQA